MVMPTYRKPQPQPAKQRCYHCQGSGRAPCPICNGSGEVLKGRDANGRAIFGRCDGCFGNKTARCSRCNGLGFT